MHRWTTLLPRGVRTHHGVENLTNLRMQITGDQTAIGKETARQMGLGPPISSMRVCLPKPLTTKLLLREPMGSPGVSRAQISHRGVLEERDHITPERILASSAKSALRISGLCRYCSISNWIAEQFRYSRVVRLARSVCQVVTMSAAKHRGVRWQE